MSEDRLLSPNPDGDDQQVEKSLRPRSLAEFIGQEKTVGQLKIAIAAAKARSEPLDHTLFYGPPGLGKTTLAGVIAQEMGVKIKITSGPAIERAGDLAAVLTNLQKDDVLFIDEVHRLNRAVEEVLYPAMEDFALDIMVGKGPSARSMRLKPAALHRRSARPPAWPCSPRRCATASASVYRLDFYDDDAMREIVRPLGAHPGRADRPTRARLEIARRARGTPRIANRLLRRVRDYAQVRADGVIDCAGGRATALAQLEVDELGLDEIDRTAAARDHRAVQRRAGGPEHPRGGDLPRRSDTIEDVYEPFLLQLGFLQRTPRGRIATRRAYEHLGLPYTERGSAGDDPNSPQQGRMF